MGSTSSPTSAHAGFAPRRPGSNAYAAAGKTFRGLRPGRPVRHRPEKTGVGDAVLLGTLAAWTFARSVGAGRARDALQRFVSPRCEAAANRPARGRQSRRRSRPGPFVDIAQARSASRRRPDRFRKVVRRRRVQPLGFLIQRTRGIALMRSVSPTFVGSGKASTRAAAVDGAQPGRQRRRELNSTHRRRKKLRTSRSTVRRVRVADLAEADDCYYAWARATGRAAPTRSPHTPAARGLAVPVTERR